MKLSLSTKDLIAKAISDIRLGLPVIVEGFLVFGVETINNRFWQQIKPFASGSELVITEWRAKTLKARVYLPGLVRVPLSESADLIWLKSMADPASDLRNPMKGPVQSIREGSSDIAKAGLLLAKRARILPSVLVVPVVDELVSVDAAQITVISQASDAIDILDEELALSDVVSASLPLQVSENSRLHVFRPEDGGSEHYAIEIGKLDRTKPITIRLHSACFTGDLLGSLKCDCGPQLRGAMKYMGEQGSGLLLYLDQEGRGIGLANKMRAYALQNDGFDTVEANHRLGFEDDERDFRIAASMLRDLKVTSVNLLTNNPKKVESLSQHGIEVVERLPLKVEANPHSANYLKVKAEKSGHLL